MRCEVLFNITSDAIIVFNRTAFVWIAARANVIIVTFRFVKLILFFPCRICCRRFWPQQNIALRYAAIFFQEWQNQNTWEYQFWHRGTRAIQQLRSVSRHKIEPRKALCARLLRGAWNAPSSRKRRALAFYLLAIFYSNCILLYLLQIFDYFMIALLVAL